jgi:hypothetical protein
MDPCNYYLSKYKLPAAAVSCSCFRGYVGTWTSFDMQHADSSSAAAAAAAAAAGGGGDAANHAEAAAAAAVRVSPVFVDETVNFRLFRMEDPAAMKYHQVNAHEYHAVKAIPLPTATFTCET